MRTFCVLFMMCVAPAVFAPAYGQITQPNYTLTISAGTPTVKAGTNVFIKIKMTNISDHVVDCTESAVGSLLATYQYEVRDEEGKPVRKRDKLYRYPFSIWDKCDLEPGKTVDREALISWLYDFTNPGQYVIQVSRGGMIQEHETRASELVKSNTITITVVASDKPVEHPVYPVWH